MKRYSEKAFAKINLSLAIVGLRPDGYHNISSVMQTLSLCDTVSVSFCGGGLLCRCGAPGVPSDRTNLAAKAAEAFFADAGLAPVGLTIDIKKRIPVQAGLGGGSADAAAVLRVLDRAYPGALSREKLSATAARLGGDVPFCLTGGTALAEGAGERLTPVKPLPFPFAVVCMPDARVCTREAYAAADAAMGARFSAPSPDTDDPLAFCARAANDFQIYALPEAAGRLLSLMEGSQTPFCRMSGSGPACYALFEKRGEAADCAAKLKKAGYRPLLARLG